MTSQISLGKLLLEDFRHRRWMLILSMVVQIILGPVVVLFSVTAEKNTSLLYMDWELVSRVDRAIQRSLRTEYGWLGTLIAVVGAVIVGIVSFKHLYSKRSMDLYGSIPVSRVKQFMVTYINGVLIYIIPFIVNVIITGIIVGVSVSDRASFVLALNVFIHYFWRDIFTFFAIYHLCLVAVMLAGNAFAAIVNAVLIGALVLSGYAVIYMLASTHLETFMAESANSFINIAWLSPVSVPFILNIYGSDYYNAYYSSYVNYIILSAVLILVNFFVAAALHRNRKAELAENGVKNKIYLAVVRVAVCIIGGLFLSDSINILLGYNSELIGWNIFFLVFGCVLSFGLVNMILHKSGKAFFKDVFFMIGATLIAGAIFVFICISKIYDYYLPSEDNIASAKIYFDRFNDAGIRYNVTDSGVETTARNEGLLTIDDKLNKFTTTDKKLVHKLLEMGVDNVDIDMTNYYIDNYVVKEDSIAVEDAEKGVTIYPEEYIVKDPEEMTWGFETSMAIKVTLKNGFSYYRIYNVYTDDLATIAEVVESEEYQNTMFPYGTGLVPYPDKLQFYVSNEGDTSSYRVQLENQEAIKELMDAYHEDFMNNNKVKELSRRGYKNSIECTYNNGYFDYIYTSKNYTKTNAVIEKYSVKEF